MPSALTSSNGFMAVGIADRKHTSPLISGFLPPVSREAQLQVLHNESRGSSRRSSAVMTPDNASIASADSNKSKSKKEKSSKKSRSLFDTSKASKQTIPFAPALRL